MSINNGVFPTDVRAAAGKYLECGVVPIPVPRIGEGKGAAINGWQHLRPTADELDQLFPPSESLNVGLLLGEPSGGLVDIDLDQPEAVLAAPILLPPTGWISGHAKSPRSHYWYRVAEPPNSAQIAFKDLDGKMVVEIRSTGGQTIAPPSMHYSGAVIQWYSLVRPGEPEIAQLRVTAQEVAAVTILARHWPQKGSRQDAYMALSGGLNRAGWSIERMTRFLEALCHATQDDESRKRLKTIVDTSRKAQEGPTTGWPSLGQLLTDRGNDVVARVRTWLGITSERPQTKVREIPPFQPFPVHCLPEPVRRFVCEGAAALGCDTTYLALPALSVMGGCIGNTRVIRLKNSWDEPAVVWTMVIGDSGTLKSPAYQKVVGYLFRKQKQLIQEFKKALAEHQIALVEYKANKAEAEKRDEEPPEPPEPPVLQRIICSDTTIEKLAEILDDNPRGTLVARDELAGWLGSFTKYKAQKGSTDLPNWLEMHRAGTVIVDRKTGNRTMLFVPNAAVSVTGGIQPGILARAMASEFFDAGLPARILPAFAAKKPKLWTDLDISPDTEQGYHDLIDRLVELECNREYGESCPHVLKLSPEAKALWIRFYDEWAAEQAQVAGDMAAAFSKLEGYAARLALIHHVASHVGVDADDLRPIGIKSMEAGIELVRWFAHEAHRIYLMLSENDEQRELRHVLEFVRARGGRIRVRQLQKSNSRKYPDSESAEQALNRLVEAGLADWEDGQSGAKGGHPTRWLILRSTSDTTDTRPDEDGDGGGSVSDTRPDPKPTPPQNHVETEQVSVVSDVGSTRGGDQGADSDSGREERVSETSVGHSGSLSHILVESAADLAMVLGALDQSRIIGLDLETTGLDPRRDRIRLLTLACDTIDGGQFAYVIDLFKVDARQLWESLAESELVIHNAAFDLGFLWQLGFRVNARVHDTMLLAQLVTAGTRAEVNLSACCGRWLNQALNKEHQGSNWTGSLSAEQVEYAAIDALVLRPLLDELTKEIDTANLARVADIECRCLPAIVWMAQSGVAFDSASWNELAGHAEQEAKQLRQRLDQLVTDKPDGELFEASWNWDSPAQVKQVLAQLGIEVDDTNDETLARIDHPLAARIREYREARKRVTSYGDKWSKYVHDDGRIYPHWRQIGASSGRMACSEPNMQNLPRGDYRRCVVAPPGRVLIKADYSQIELRIAAKLTGDPALLQAYQNGEDLHERTARMVLGVQEVTKDHRQLAKALNFGLLYGMGAKGFRDYARTSFGVDLSENDAVRYRRAFFQSYPGLATWHRRVGNTERHPIETRTLPGRRCCSVHQFNEKLNLPVQGTGADGMKAVLALLWARRDQVVGTFPVLAVHDEIVIEAPDVDRDAVAEWLKQTMVDAMTPLIAPVPVEVETKIGTTWGG